MLLKEVMEICDKLITAIAVLSTETYIPKKKRSWFFGENLSEKTPANFIQESNYNTIKRELSALKDLIKTEMDNHPNDNLLLDETWAKKLLAKIDAFPDPFSFQIALIASSKKIDFDQIVAGDNFKSPDEGSNAWAADTLMKLRAECVILIEDGKQLRKLHEIHDAYKHDMKQLCGPPASPPSTPS